MRPKSSSPACDLAEVHRPYRAVGDGDLVAQARAVVDYAEAVLGHGALLARFQRGGQAPRRLVYETLGALVARLAAARPGRRGPWSLRPPR